MKNIKQLNSELLRDLNNNNKKHRKTTVLEYVIGGGLVLALAITIIYLGSN